MGEKKDGPKGGHSEYCGQDRLRRLWLTPVKDEMGKLLWSEMGETWGEREGFTRLEAAMERKGLIAGERMSMRGWEEGGGVI